MKNKRIVIMLLFPVMSLQGFSSLDSAQNYAQSHNEFVELKNKNLVLDPNYTAWYQAHAPSLFERMLEFLNIKKTDWSVKSFTSLLINQVALRESKGYSQEHTLIMRPAPGTQFIIFGPVFGSFHSLVRDLGELKKLGLLSNDFKIVSKNTYIIFNGNVIDGSPYILETLTLVLALMQNNPEQVIYISGEHEYREYWKGAGLQTELNERIGNMKMESYLTRLFSTLPQSVLLMDSKDGAVVRIMNLSKELNDGYCLKRAEKLGVGQSMLCPLAKEKTGEMPFLSLIQAEKRLVTYSRHPGLLLLPSEGGATTWSIFSAPNTVYRDYFSFLFDAFAILTVGKTIAQSTFALYNQSIQDPKGFNNVATYDLMSGKKLKSNQAGFMPLVEKEPIMIGCTLDLSKGVSGQGKQVKLGVSLCINEQNERGGIHGRALDVVFMDDEYSPEKARQNVLDFTKKYKSDLFLCNLGSPTLEAYLDLVKAGKAFVFFPITGAPAFRKPDLLTMVHWRASYANEAKALINYIIQNYQIKDFAFLYQNDSYGIGALEGAREVLKNKGIKGSKEVSYVRNTTLFKNAIDQIKASSASAIGFFSTAIAASEFIRQAGVEFFIGKKLFALSDLAEESFKKFSRQKGLDMIIAQFSPNPATSNLEIIKSYRNALHEQGMTKEDVFMLEGYIGARILIDILDKAGQDISHQNILRVINDMKNCNFKGLTLSFNPQTRELAHKLWIDVGLSEWIEQKT